MVKSIGTRAKALLPTLSRLVSTTSDLLRLTAFTPKTMKGGEHDAFEHSWKKDVGDNQPRLVGRYKFGHKLLQSLLVA